MLTAIHPKLPMRNKAATKAFYLQQLGFSELADYGDYLLLAKDEIELHFFEYKDLQPHLNYGQVYIRCHGIDAFYKKLLQAQVAIHPNGPLENKPWGQRKFALLDPDHNLLTFGEGL